jgi:hypothetical protein
LILNPVIVDGYNAVIQVTRERIPAFQAVLDCFGCRAAIGYLLPLSDQPML